jgi:hypothetical protein
VWKLVKRAHMLVFLNYVPQLFKKLLDIIGGPWLQKDIKLPMYHYLRKFGT